MTLILHRGGWNASKADLASVVVPDPTDSYHPVPYSRFVEEVELHLPRFGLKVQSSAFGLAREGNQMFGVLTCSNGLPDSDYGLAIGLRNSYDRSLSVGLVAGTRVFCCDNLAFSGEAKMQRKHTAMVFRDLPDLIYRMLNQVSSMKAKIAHEVAAMKVCALPTIRAHHLMVEAIRRSIIPASKLPKLLEVWEHPEHEQFRPRTAWSLLNAFTELQKSVGARTQMEGSLRLTSLIREEVLLA